MTPPQLAAKIGCVPSTVNRAAKRLGLEPPFDRSAIAKLKKEIQPGNKRGHWPAGKPRNTPSDDWPEIRSRLQATLNGVSRSHALATGTSIRGLAEHLRVSARQVSRWVRGEDLPPAKASKLIRSWLDDLRPE